MLVGSFEFFKLLRSKPLALPAILQESLLSLLLEIIEWSAERDVPVRGHPLMYKHLHPLLNLLIYSSVIDIKEKAYVLAKAAMSSTGAFDHNLREIGIWFLFLPRYSSNDLFLEDHCIDMRQNPFSAVVSFLCKAVSTMANNLFKYLDLLRRHIHLTGVKGDTETVIRYLLVIIENLSSNSEHLAPCELKHGGKFGANGALVFFSSELIP